MKNSKRGVSLVEEICSVLILAIGVLAVMSAIGFSHASVTSDSMQEAAAAQTQELADTLIAGLSKKQAVPVNLADAANAKQVNAESAFGCAAGDKARQFFVETVTDASAGTVETAGYKITCRVYYNGGKRYIQMKAYASARGDGYTPGA